MIGSHRANQSTLRRVKLVTKHAPAGRVQRFIGSTRLGKDALDLVVAQVVIRVRPRDYTDH